MKKKILTLLVLLMTAVTGAWATDYYVVGTMTGWQKNDQYKMTLNASAATTEYQLGIALAATDQFKVIGVDGDNPWVWYPSGDNYGQNGELTADGLYTIYFRPDGDGGSDWFYNCIYLAEGAYLAETSGEWTLTQPAFDVELEMEYYPLATLATLPAAAEGVIAGSTTALVSTGVADGGTIYYALGTDDVTAPTDGWTSTVPTAESFTETGTAYVWYMVVGDDEHSDSEVIGCVAVPVTSVSYYVVGTMTDPTWAINTAYQLLPNTENAGEYYIHNVTLTAGTELKVVSDGAVWYPSEGGEGSNYVVPRDATYSIYFRPDYQGGYGWHYGCIYAQKTAVTLDEVDDNTAILAELNGKTADITLTRTLKAGSWNTVALPFSASGLSFAQKVNAMGITAVKELSTVTLEGETLKLNFQTATSLVAGKPYLVKVAADVENPTFAGVTVSNATVPTETAYVDFIPTLGKTTITGDDATSVLFLAAGNKLKNPDKMPTDMKGFRAYFQLKDGSTARSFSLNLGDGEATGIETTDFTDRTDGVTYDLQGRRVNGAAKKGVYVVNGKKAVVR